MGTLIVRAIAILFLPIVVFSAGAAVLQKLSDPSKIREKIQTETGQKGLGLRPFGYSAAAVKTYWDCLKSNPGALEAEQRSWEIDLVFPFFYGAAFAATLLCAWAALGRPFHPGFILAPVFIEVVADWIENLVQLGQLKLYRSNGGAALQAGWIQVASAATMVKYLLFFVSSLLIIFMVGWMVIKNWPRSTAG